MGVQMLVATMNQSDHSLLDKMNIQTDAIIGNQCNFNSIESFEYKGCNITYLNFCERGVGLNRNNSLMRAKNEICFFADDDIRYVDGYGLILEGAFDKYKNADVIIFNLFEQNSERKAIKKVTRVRWFNFLRYGTARIAFRLKSVKENGIYFNECFGGGTEHSHGEDNIFLSDCLRKKLKIIALPVFLGEIKNTRESTWNNGYNEKYVSDQGKLYKTISKKWWKLLCFQDALRRHKSYGMSILKAYKTMVK